CQKLMLHGDFAGALPRLRLLPNMTSRYGVLTSNVLILRCLLGLGDWAGLYEFSQRELTRDPKDISFEKFRAVALLHLGRTDEAKVLATTIISKQGAILEEFKGHEGQLYVRASYLSSAVALEILGRREEAVAHLDKFFQSGGGYPDLFAIYDPLPVWIF